MNIISKSIVLKLNKAWQAVGQSTVGKAIVDLAAGQSAFALNLEYEKDDNGNYILDASGAPLNDAISAIPVDWETWIDLPVRSFDEVIHYGNGSKTMRAPTILIAKNFSKMPKKSFKGKPSKEAIIIRDGGIDQYTGKKLRRDEITIDHVVPRSKGGKDTWENQVSTSKEINSKKGNKSNAEAGLNLIKQPKAPAPITLTQLIREVRHFTWRPHLPHLKDN